MLALHDHLKKKCRYPNRLWWFQIVILIWISLMTNGMGPLFICLFPIDLCEFLFKSFTICIFCLLFCLVSFTSYWSINLCVSMKQIFFSDICDIKIFPLFDGLYFNFLNDIFQRVKLFILRKSSLSIFLFRITIFHSYLKNFSLC